MPRFVPFFVQAAAERGALGSRAARALNAGMILAALPHMRVLLPIFFSECGRQQCMECMRLAV